MTRILVGDALERLRELPDGSAHCCVTSPPYWGLRSYEGGERMIGLEPTFDAHLERLVEVFREVRRVLQERWHVLAELRRRLRCKRVHASGGSDQSSAK